MHRAKIRGLAWALFLAAALCFGVVVVRSINSALVVRDSVPAPVEFEDLYIDY